MITHPCYPEEPPDTAESRGIHPRPLNVSPFLPIPAPRFQPRTHMAHCAPWKAAHSLEGHPKETPNCAHEGICFRESQLSPQPHRLHCPEPHRLEESWHTSFPWAQLHGNAQDQRPTRQLKLPPPESLPEIPGVAKRGKERGRRALRKNLSLTQLCTPTPRWQQCRAVALRPRSVGNGRVAGEMHFISSAGRWMRR